MRHRLTSFVALCVASLAAPSAVADVPAEPKIPSEPLAGWSNQSLYLRSGDGAFTLFPHGRLQSDFYFFPKRGTDKMPNDTFMVRRMRLESFGWIGDIIGFSVSADIAASPPAAGQSQLASGDNYVFIAPRQNLAIVQVGQFDSPFTYENRMSDKTMDFMEKSLTTRNLGVQPGKEQGLMVHGLLPEEVAYYALGLFNGDGQNFKNQDSDFDLMGRAWLAPFAMAGIEALKEATRGGSFWMGTRERGRVLAPHTTQGGLAFFEPVRWKATPSEAANLELRQDGDLRALAAEVHVPFDHRYGLRGEFIHKRQYLTTVDASKSAFAPVGRATCEATAWYAQAWAWILGDDRIPGDRALQLPPRWRGFTSKAPEHGLVVLAKVEHLEATVAPSTAPGLNPVAGTTKVDAYELGINYWYSKRFRATINYVLNRLSGGAVTARSAIATNGGSASEHEVSMRMAIAL